MADISLTWLQKHEKIIIGVILFGVILFLGNKYLDYQANQTNSREKTAQQVLQSQKDANAAIAAQNEKLAQQNAALQQQMNQQNAKLTAEIIQLGQSLAARQKQDAALPLPDLAIRWENLLGVSSGITATPDGLIVNQSSSVQTVQNLEALPVVKQELSITNEQKQNVDKELTSANGLIVDLNKQVSGLNLQLTDAGNSCKLQVAAAKKSRWKYFKIGVVTGFLGGLWTGHKL